MKKSLAVALIFMPEADDRNGISHLTHYFFTNICQAHHPLRTNFCQAHCPTSSKTSTANMSKRKVGIDSDDCVGGVPLPSITGG
jgi:hypothetical protein